MLWTTTRRGKSQVESPGLIWLLWLCLFQVWKCFASPEAYGIPQPWRRPSGVLQPTQNRVDRFVLLWCRPPTQQLWWPPFIISSAMAGLGREKAFTSLVEQKTWISLNSTQPYIKMTLKMTTIKQNKVEKTRNSSLFFSPKRHYSFCLKEIF